MAFDELTGEADGTANCHDWRDITAKQLAHAKHRLLSSPLIRIEIEARSQQHRDRPRGARIDVAIQTGRG